MDNKKVYKIIPVEFEDIVDGAYVLTSPDGEQYKISGGNFPTKRGKLIRLDSSTFLRLMNDITIVEDLEEIVILNDEDDKKDKDQHGELNVSNTKRIDQAVWPEEATKILLDMCKKLRPLVDTSEIRTMKQMWEQICDSLKKNGYNYDYQQVGGKWKSLVRSYRGASQPGVKRKGRFSIVPFEKEIHEILSKSDSMNTPTKDDHSENIHNGISQQKKIKLNTEENSSRYSNFNPNTGGINFNLVRIARAIETDSIKREKAEERKMEQRERLIQAIEKGNTLLSKLLQEK